VKRVAELLVEQVVEHGRLMMALAAAPTGERDRATLGVSATVIALGVAKTLTDDRLALTDLALAGLLHDVGRARLLRGASGARALHDEEDDRIPASAALALTALGKLEAWSIAPTAILFEALWLRRQHRLGPLFRGKRPPSVLARILDVAWAFVEQRTAVTGRPLPRIDEAIEQLSKRAAGPTERAYVQLLLGALGFFPVGTLVELDTAEVAVVTAAPELPIDFARPRVRVLYGRSGEQLETPRDLDLAAPHERAERSPRRARIVRPLEADERQRAVMRSAMRAPASESPRAQPAPSIAPESPRPKPAPVAAPSSLGPAPVSPAMRAQPYGSRGFGTMDNSDDEPPSYSPVRPPVPSIVPELDDPFHTGRFAADKILAAHHAALAPLDLDAEPVSTRTFERGPVHDFPDATAGAPARAHDWPDGEDPLGPPTIPPPPALSERDRLLASFLADEPLEGDKEDEREPEK
jgi:hypothetical protein